MQVYITSTTVDCAIGPSVNTLRAQLIFANPIFAICLNFQQQSPLKNQYLPQLSSEIFMFLI